MFSRKREDGYKTPLRGIQMKTLVHGEKTLLTEFRLSRGSVLPMHSHPHEQTGYLVSGKINLTIGDRMHAADPGDSWCIPPNVEHGAEVLKDAVAVEVFSPVREDYLP